MLFYVLGDQGSNLWGIWDKVAEEIEKTMKYHGDMWVLDVIPFARAAPQAPLSYRSSKDLEPGTLITIPLRKRMVTGLVVGSMPVREAKAELKSAMFSLSASSSKVQGMLPLEILTAAKNTALYHATTLGAVLSALLVPVLPTDPTLTTNSNESFLPIFSPLSTSNLEDRNLSTKSRQIPKVQKRHVAQEHLSRIEMPFLDRLAAYTEIISQAYSYNFSGKSAPTTSATLLVVPTQIEAEEWSTLLKKFKPIVLTGKVTGKRREAALAKVSSLSSSDVLSGDMPQLIITTPNFSWLPIPNLSHIIIERVSAGSYMLPKRPYIDVRYSLTQLAQARAVPITYGDYPLPIEYRDPAKYSSGILSDTQDAKDSPLATRATLHHTIEVFDSRAEKNSVTAQAWQAIPGELRAEIKKALENGNESGGKNDGENNGTVAVLATRRGYAPSVVCSDCGTAVTDELGRNLALATVHGKRVLRSSDGKIVESAATFCKTCGGWNLIPLGIGIERIEEELREAFPNAPIVRIDQDSLKRSVSLKKIRAEISEPGTITIGTELMLPILSPQNTAQTSGAPFATLGIIASADSLLALPFWRSRERFIRTGLMLAERCERTIIATRRPEDNTALTSLVDPANDAFWKEESELRKTLSYPPFGTLIIFHIDDGGKGKNNSEGGSERNSARREAARAAIKTACLPYTPYDLATSLVLQISDGEWPRQNQNGTQTAELSARLAALPPSIRITINSEMLW